MAGGEVPVTQKAPPSRLTLDVQMDSPLLLSLPHVPTVAISPPRLDPTTLAIAIEGALKTRITNYRASFLHQQHEPGTDAGTSSPHTPPSRASLEAAARGHKLPAPPSGADTSTAWDDRLGFITTQALVSFETARNGGAGWDWCHTAMTSLRSLPLHSRRSASRARLLVALSSKQPCGELSRAAGASRASPCSSTTCRRHG